MWAVSALSSLLWVAHATAAPQPEALPQAAAGYKQLAYVGCFSSSETLVDQGQHVFQTSGYCQQVCVNITKPVMGLKDGSNCWCGDLLPPETAKVEDGRCDIPCTGYDKDMCEYHIFNMRCRSLLADRSSINRRR